MSHQNTRSGFRLPKPAALFSACLISLQLLSGAVQAQTAISPTTWTGNTSSLSPSNFTARPASTTPGSSDVNVSQWQRNGSLGDGTGSSFNSKNWTTGTTLAAAVSANSDISFTITNSSTKEVEVTKLVILSQVSATGPKNVQLQYAIGGGSNNNFGTALSTVHNANPETFTFNGTAHICAGQTATFKLYGWNAAATGTLRVNNNTALTATFTTAVSATASSNSPVSAGSPLNFTSTVSNGITSYSYAWSGPLAYTSTAANPTISSPGTSASGTYSLTVTDNWGCTASATTAVTVNPADTCTGNPGAGTINVAPGTICAGNSSILTLTPSGTGTGITYLWLSSTTGPTGPWTSTGVTTLTFNTGTLSSTKYYTCVSTCTHTGLSDTASGATVTVNALPNAATISGGTTIIGGGSAVITFNGDANNVVTYTTNGGSPATITLDGTGVATLTVSPIITTVYAITSTQSPAGCITTESGVSTTVTVQFDFHTGNLVVWLSNGTTSAGTSISLLQYDNTIANQPSPLSTNLLPFTGAGRIVSSGSATTEGHLTLDAERTHIILAGYDTTTGVASIATAGGINRVVYSVPQTGSASEVANVPQSNAYAAGNIRSAVANGSDYFATGTSGTSATAGVQLMGASTSAQVTATTLNTRVAEIFNGQLFYSTASALGGPLGIYAVGSGIPTSGLPVTSTNIVATDSNSSSHAFSISPDSKTIYIADDGNTGTPTKGIRKYTLSGGVYSLAYTLAANAGARSLVVDYSTNPYTIYATTASNTATIRDSLIKILDSNSTAQYYVLATSATGASFRGVTLAPSCNATIYANGSTSFCSGDSTKIVFYGNPGATVVYSLNGVNDTITLASNGTDTLNTGALVSTSGSTDYVFSLVGIHTSVCDFTSLSGSVTVTVNAAPSIDDISADSTHVLVDSILHLFEDPTSAGTWSISNGALTLDTTGFASTGQISVTGVTAGQTDTVSYTVTNACGSTTVSIAIDVIGEGGKHATSVANTGVSSNVSMYPNPVTNVLHINAAEAVNVSIIDIYGKVVMQQNNAVNINVSSLATGVYLLKVYNHENTLITTTRFNKN